MYSSIPVERAQGSSRLMKSNRDFPWTLCHIYISELALDRYKFVVQVVIGEQRGEGVWYVAYTHTHTRLSLAILLSFSLEKVLCELSIESEMQWCSHVTLCVYMCCCHVCEFYVCLLSPHTGWDVGVSGTRIQTITLRKLLQMCGIQNHHFTLPFIACRSLEHVAIRTVTSV